MDHLNLEQSDLQVPILCYNLVCVCTRGIDLHTTVLGVPNTHALVLEVADAHTLVLDLLLFVLADTHSSVV